MVVRLRQALASTVAWFHAVGTALGHLWRRSLQLRVIVSTLTLSLIVITILGVVLTSQITDRLLDAKVNAAIEEMDRARNTVESQLAGVPGFGAQPQRLVDARDALSNRDATGQSAGAAGSFDAALSAVGGMPMQRISAGPIEEVPDELRRFVQRNQVSYQFATVSDSDGYRGRALIIGSPSDEIPTLEIYLIFPLGNEERSLALMRGTMLVGGGVLLVLLAAITALVTRQVVLPIRSAARIAGRFADGRLKERMLVRGEDDMARLAQAFNEMAESLSNQITQLEEFGNLQRRFTSDVSHELRTPLTTVRMAADLIHSSSDDLEPALARSAELLVNELDRFECLLNDLLEISRHDAGVAELQVESLDVRMCARAAISTVRHLAKDAGVEVITDLPEEPLVAEVDPRRMERVLRNLLANAIDHGEGKPVLLRMRADVSANAVAVVVRDQGVGLRAGEEKLVFNRFWRSDPSRMRRSGGTGLGLSISAEDTNLHEGKLEACGELGQGASFRLTLPMVRGKKMGPSPLSLEPTRTPKPAGESESSADLDSVGAQLPEPSARHERKFEQQLSSSRAASNGTVEHGVEAAPGDATVTGPSGSPATGVQPAGGGEGRNSGDVQS
ncbi:MtrAB system histidine kinase MtrB [Nocardia sp. CNY236]|uniref:MtrAB system histidine kinase MtrB n=1 Tax=Nocardia sp. CNY236 TaxID=1169152 RepID=UPI0018C967C3